MKEIICLFCNHPISINFESSKHGTDRYNCHTCYVNYEKPSSHSKIYRLTVIHSDRDKTIYVDYFVNSIILKIEYYSVRNGNLITERIVDISSDEALDFICQPVNNIINRVERISHFL